ncbi:uncharacterized protein N7483_012963 [Penicillium malachiteum]|uniref:uncharacterized protein n=1 Tax=Penicillium malachiteum TaxID=1324776 RepID=UPI00254690C9|nr:uncharacterized protein N7483_012963 [Penicillium malachiteum]KAJ5715782.1 hypothetical protein N7483_012963 [Penicillium malachiteum]
MQHSDIITADEDWLIDLCHRSKEEGGMIGGNKHGDKVIKISEQVVVKYGYVQESEAATQELAVHAMDRNVIHIPEVYWYIESHRSLQPVGYIFGDDGAKTAFTSLDYLTRYKRLQYRNNSIDLEPYAQNLVLCHGDICRRNMIMKEDGALALVDWAYSGFYPRFFELATLTCLSPYDKEFQPLVKNEFENSLELTDQESKT